MDILTLIKFGLQSLLSKLSASKSAEEPTSEDSKTAGTSEIKVHKIIAGPFAASDDPDFDSDFEEDYFWIDAMVEVDGEIMDLTLGHSDFNAIYVIKKHLDSATVEPYVIGGSND
jgi:hypothetical protein